MHVLRNNSSEKPILFEGEELRTKDIAEGVTRLVVERISGCDSRGNNRAGISTTHLFLSFSEATG